MQHALVLSVDGRTTDAHMLRVVERAHEASGATVVVIHPSAATPVDRDRRWTTLFERAAALHGNVRLAPATPAADRHALRSSVVVTGTAHP